MTRGTWVAMIWLRHTYSREELADFIERRSDRLTPRDLAYWSLICGVRRSIPRGVVGPSGPARDRRHHARPTHRARDARGRRRSSTYPPEGLRSRLGCAIENHTTGSFHNTRRSNPTCRCARGSPSSTRESWDARTARFTSRSMACPPVGFAIDTRRSQRPNGSPECRSRSSHSTTRCA